MKIADPLFTHNPPIFQLKVPEQYQHLPPPSDEELAKLEDYEKDFCANRVHEVHNAAAMSVAKMYKTYQHPNATEIDIVERCPNPGSYANQDILIMITQGQIPVTIRWVYALCVVDFSWTNAEGKTCVVTGDIYDLMLNYSIDRESVLQFMTYIYGRISCAETTRIDLFDKSVDEYMDGDIDAYEEVNVKRKYKPKYRHRVLHYTLKDMPTTEEDTEICGKRKRIQ